VATRKQSAKENEIFCVISAAQERRLCQSEEGALDVAKALMGKKAGDDWYIVKLVKQVRPAVQLEMWDIEKRGLPKRNRQPDSFADIGTIPPNVHRDFERHYGYWSNSARSWDREALRHYVRTGEWL
jgi:hypothetical protein